MMQADVVLVALADISRDARTLNLARALAAAHLRVAVVAASPAHWSDPDITLHRWLDPGGSAFKRWRSLNSFARSLKLNARVVGAMDLFALASATRLARRTAARVVYDMREFYFALGPLQGRGLKQRLIAWYERRDLPSTIIVTSQLDADIVMAHFRLKVRPHVLMNTPPYRDRVLSTLLRDRFKIPDADLIVIYQGVVHSGRGLKPFMKALTKMPDVHLCIVGDGPQTSEMESAAAMSGVRERVHWYGSVPYDELHEVTCSADVGLCLIEPVSLSYEYALPNKLFEYMMARIPSLVSDLPALRQQMSEAPVGVLVDPALAETDICNAVDRLRIPGTRAAFIEHCEAIRELSYERQAASAVDLFRELLT